MLGRVVVLGVVACITLLVAGAALADHPGGGGTPMFATLTPEAECVRTGGPCGVGQPGASGEIEMRLNSGQEEICFTTTAQGLTAPVVGAHIHRGAAGEVNPVLVGFTPTLGSGCVFAPREVIKEIRQNPENFYFNVHTTAFRGGAIRGQLCGPGRGNCR